MYNPIIFRDFAEIRFKGENRRFQRFFECVILPYLKSTKLENPIAQ